MKSRKFRRSSVNGYQYIQKDAEWLESPAYRDLRPLARCLLEEFLIIYRPFRNGRLNLPTKEAAQRLGVSENTVLNAYDDLVEHGFLVMEQGEIWIERKAREWRLTMMPRGNSEPTDDWERWLPNCPVRLTRRGKKSRSKKFKQIASRNEAALPQKLRLKMGKPESEKTH